MDGKLIDFTVDASQTLDLLNSIRANVKPERFNQILYSEFSRVGSKVRSIMKKDLPVDYYVKGSDIEKAVKSPQMVNGAQGIGCIIPITDRRGSIGGTFKAYGGMPGWTNVGHPYRISADIVKEKRSILPEKMEDGLAPFINTAAQKLNGVAFYRKGKPRLPIKKITGIAIPQMPLNRSLDEVQKDIGNALVERLNHRLNRIMMGKM